METIAAVKEHPILFSTPMVQAILEGRKTQTRRLVKVQPKKPLLPVGMGYYSEYPESLKVPYIKCPYGQVGERLWVREKIQTRGQRCSCYIQPCDCTEIKIVYLADSATDVFSDMDFPEGFEPSDTMLQGRTYPSIHMPRWASRILLEITDVRVERLHGISEEDAKAEGVTIPAHYTGITRNKAAFCELWQSINGKESWEANPWVWVVSFKRIEP